MFIAYIRSEYIDMLTMILSTYVLQVWSSFFCCFKVYIVIDYVQSELNRLDAQNKDTMYHFMLFERCNCLKRRGRDNV